MATKFGTKSATTRLISDISTKTLRITGGFHVKLSIAIREILKRQTLVAMATKFQTKSAVTRLI